MSSLLPDDTELHERLQKCSPQEAVDYLNQLGELAAQQQPSRIVEFARHAYERALQLGYRSGLAEAQRLLGVGAVFAGNYAEAQDWFSRAHALFQELGCREKALHTLVSWALAEHSVGEHAAALERLRSVVEHGAEFPTVYLKALQNLAIVLAELGHHEQALRMFEEVITQAQAQGQWQTLARAYNNAALLLATRGEHSQALELQQRSVQLKEEHGDRYGLAVAYGTLGYLYARMERWDEAEAAYQRSLSLRREIGDRRGVGYVLSNLGQLYRQRGLDAAAREALTEAWTIAEELQETVLELEAARELAHLAQHQGRAEEAMYFLHRCLVLMERLLSERVQQAVTQIQARYVLEQQRRQQEELRRLLVEWQYRALQAQMNPHFLFNALNLLQHWIARGEREVAHRFIAEFAQLMRCVLHNAQRGLISLREELETVELYLRIQHARFQGAFTYSVEVCPEVDADEVWVPPLLLQPLVENALKHGLAPRGGRGTVRIVVMSEGETVLCAIEDDGVGRGQKGVLSAPGTGFGLRLVEERLRLLREHLGGGFALRIEDLQDAQGRPAGTRVAVVIPQSVDVVRATQLHLLEPLGSAPKPVFSP